MGNGAGGLHSWCARVSLQLFSIKKNCLARSQSPQATLLYGVLCLQRDFPGQAALPLDTLREACRALHAEAAVAAALPRIRSQFASLEAEVGGFLDENRAGDGAQVRRLFYRSAEGCTRHGAIRLAGQVAHTVLRLKA